MSRGRTTLAALGIAGAALLAHGGSLRSGFVWDDEAVIVENPATRDLSALPRVLLSPDERPPYYRPLNRASYLLDHALFGMDPRGFHALNLALHALSAGLLFLLGLRLFGNAWPAALAGLVLAAHPLAVEAVSFVTARNNLFALVFSLVSALAFLRALERRSRTWAVVSAVAFLLGLLSKEPAGMVLPLFATWLAVRPSSARPEPVAGRAENGPRRLFWLLPHLAALGVYLVLRSVSLSGAPAPVDAPSPGLVHRVTALAWIVPEYLRLLVWPSGLTVFHAATPTLGVAVRLLAWAVLLSIVAVQGLRPTAAGMFGLLWAALTFAPASGLVAIPASPVAERFLYLPLAGLALVVADLAWRAWPEGRTGLAASAVAVAAFLAIAVRTVARTADWHDDVALFSSAAKVDPESRQAWFNLGVAHKDAGDLDAARRAWEAALRLDPAHAEAHAQLGTLFAVRGDYAQAEQHLRLALAARPDLDLARRNLVLLLERAGRPAEANAVRTGPRPATR